MNPRWRWALVGLALIAGASVLLDPPEPGAIAQIGSDHNRYGEYLFVTVHADRNLADWHAAAKRACEGKERCHVYGWTAREDAATALPFTEREGARIAFLYEIDRERGYERVAWDCQRWQRDNVLECLTKLDLPG